MDLTTAAAVRRPQMSAEEQGLQWFTRPLAFLRECHRRLGDVFELDLAGWGRHLCLSRPEHVREVLVAPPSQLEGGSGNAPLQPLLGGQSLLILGGERHAAHRRLLNAGFTAARVAAVEPALRRAAERSIERWPTGEPFALLPALSRLSLDVILEHMLGEADPRFATIGDLLQRLLHSGPFSLRFFDEAVAAAAVAEYRRDCAGLEAALHDAIESRRHERDRGVLSSLVEQGGLSASELRDELVTLVVAGHITTSAATAWTLAYACRQPEVMRKLVTPTPEYVEAVCQEGLRMMPVIPVIARRAVADVEIAGTPVSAGTHVMPCIYLVHHGADLYPEPERFLPERFLGGRRFAAWEYLPFGGGNRHCLGAAFALAEMSAIVQLVSSRFRLTPVDAEPPEPVRSALLVVPADGARVVASRR